MKVALLGGTKGIGRAILRLLTDRGHSVCLLGRNLEDLSVSANDAVLRSGRKTPVSTFYCDLSKPETFTKALADADEKLEKLDTIIVTAASFAIQETLEKNLEMAREMLSVNFTNTIIFCEHARKHILANGGGTLCVVSSVSGERGRKPVILYGASKAGLSNYLEGLDHKYYSQGLRTVCIKPGFIKTGMTASIQPPPFSGTPEQVAKHTLIAIEKEVPVSYTPRIWRYIMFVIRNLPRFVMRKISL